MKWRWSISRTRPHRGLQDRRHGDDTDGRTSPDSLFALANHGSKHHVRQVERHHHGPRIPPRRHPQHAHGELPPAPVTPTNATLPGPANQAGSLHPLERVRHLDPVDNQAVLPLERASTLAEGRLVELYADVFGDPHASERASVVVRVIDRDTCGAGARGRRACVRAQLRDAGVFVEAAPSRAPP